jgi:hypothetical protein
VARPRKPSSAYERRNERARALGYRNYYDYRLHDNGKQPPGPVKLSRAERRRRRGHVGRADFLASLGEGDLIILPYGLSGVEFDEDARDGLGAYVEVEKLVIHARGGESTWYLRNLTRDEMIDVIYLEQQRGAVFSPAPSLDQRRLVSDFEIRGGY